MKQCSTHQHEFIVRGEKSIPICIADYTKNMGGINKLTCF